jgi:hypothetical protein
MMTIMSLGYFFFLVALASTTASASSRLESWSGGGRRRSAVLMAAPGGRDALSPAVLPTGDGVLAPTPAAPVAAKPRRLVPLPPSGPSYRGHV